jgi:gamma-glutamylcyclotransferase (GGCT)/AIG2-like uncharacterized protein YtfP
MTTTRVFVYGTLMRGGRYHGLLARARHLGAARTTSGYRLYDLGPYPAMIREGDGVVTGELYEVDAATLVELDRLEGHPDLYLRQTVELDGGEVVTTYLFVDATELRRSPVILSGNWRCR